VKSGAALLVAACLSAPDFTLGLSSFRGVKAALLLPLIGAFLSLYSKEDLLAFWRRPLTVGAAAILSFAALAALVYLLRSGHDTPVGASGLELRLRDILESLLVARPRFKEFAVGWPIFWWGAYLASKGRDARPFLLVGFIASLSIVNTFCHAHVPLSLSLLRTFHGFWLGSVLGLGLISLSRRRA
jgi:hypothetical protein